MRGEVRESDDEAIVDIILNQDIDYYRDLMEEFKEAFAVAEPQNQTKLMAAYHATESAWTALVNLKNILDKE